jgi:hypothetical protein
VCMLYSMIDTPSHKTPETCGMQRETGKHDVTGATGQGTVRLHRVM